MNDCTPFVSVGPRSVVTMNSAVVDTDHEPGAVPLWVESGDTFFTRSDSLLGRLIRHAETDLRERRAGEETWANHTGVVVESGWIGPGVPVGYRPAKVVEALWHVRTGPLKVNGVRVRVFRPEPIYTQEELVRFRAAAYSYVGKRYGWWKLLGFEVKKYTGIDVPNAYCLDDRPICSYLAAKVNDAARRQGSVYCFPDGEPYPEGGWPGFGMRPQAADPDEMMDFATTERYWVER